MRPDMDPKTVEEALSRSDSAKWQEAITKEINAMEKHNTYTILDKKPGQQVVSSRIVLKTKRDGSKKARLVARGFSQIEGVDYYIENVYAPAAGSKTLRMMLAVGVEYDWYHHGLDVNEAYLNAELKETIYMEPPRGHPLYNQNVVLKLNRAIYGLKQSANAWYKILTTCLKSIGFKVWMTRCRQMPEPSLNSCSHLAIEPWGFTTFSCWMSNGALLRVSIFTAAYASRGEKRLPKT